jgi:hypothetical protein
VDDLGVSMDLKKDKNQRSVPARVDKKADRRWLLFGCKVLQIAIRPLDTALAKTTWSPLHD